MVKRKSKLDRITLFDVVIYVFLTLAMLSCLLPVLYVITASLTPYSEVLRNGGFVIIPSEITWVGYEKILFDSGIPQAYRVTLFITVVGTLINIVFTSLTAYPLSKNGLPGMGKITLFILFTMLFNGGMIPTYLIVKDFGLIDSVWSLILPLAIYPYNVILMRTFYKSLPEEMFEAAYIDGSSEYGVLLKIATPLSLPMILTNMLFYAVIHWNTFMSAILYITQRDLMPLQVVLRDMLIGADSVIELAEYTTPTQTLKMAAVVVSALPLVIVYPFIQKYFARGMMLGAVKG